MRGFLVADAWRQGLVHSRVGHSTKLLCTGSNNTNKVAGKSAPSIRDFDAYRQLDKLDFMTAAKMLFTAPPQKKKFGLDFHLVQLFFCCMPSLAVYLVAQYARYEIRRMEAEVELKKKQEEEEKAKEMAAKALEEIEAAESNPALLKVKVRLDALEVAVKEIAVETKKKSTGSSAIGKENTKTEKPERSHTEGKSGDRKLAVGEDHAVSQSGTPTQSNEGKKAEGEDSQDFKK